ncbi:MAG: hypothetical protein V4492_03835, partial [Chlamydiota bacterium]
MAATSSLSSKPSSSSSSPALSPIHIGKELATALNFEEGMGGFLDCRTPLLELFRTKMEYYLTTQSRIDPFFLAGLVDVFTSKSSLTTPSLSALFSKFSNSERYKNLVTQDQLGSQSSIVGQSAFTSVCFARIFADAMRTRDLTDLAKFVEQIQCKHENMEREFASLTRELGSVSLGTLFNHIDSKSDFIKQYLEQAELDPTDPLPTRKMEWIRLGADLMKSNEITLLEPSPFDFGVHAQSVLPVHRYRMGVRYFIQALQEVSQLRLLYQLEQFQLPSHLNSPVAISLFLAPQFLHIRESLNTSTSLSPTVNRSVDSAVLRSLFRLMKVNEHLDLMTQRFFSMNSMKYYTDVLHSREAQVIATYLIFGSSSGAKFSDLVPTDTPSVYPAFATEHRDVFENFVFRFLSITDYFSTIGKQAQSDLKVLREMPLFLRFGDMDRLSQRIQTAKGNPQKIDQVIAQEMDKFLVEKNTPLKLREILLFLKGEGARFADSKRTTSFQSLEKKWTTFPETVAVLLRNKTIRAKKALADLFINSPKTSSKRPISSTPSSSSTSIAAHPSSFTSVETPSS